MNSNYKQNISALVCNHLKSLPPLETVTIGGIFNQFKLKTLKERNAVNAALHRFSHGTPVSKSHKTKEYYAIRVALEYDTAKVQEVFLSLPGIKHEDIFIDKSETHVHDIKLKLSEIYGEKTINYWVSAAQYQSTGLISTARTKVRKRDKYCRLCIVENSLRQADKLSTKSLPISGYGAVEVSHIISRNMIYWSILSEIHKTTQNIFSDEAVELLKSNLRLNALHSDPRFMIALCDKHDRLIQQALETT